MENFLSISISPAALKYNPLSLAGATLGLLSGQNEAADFSPAIIICAASVVILLVASVLLFNKKKV